MSIINCELNITNNKKFKKNINNWIGTNILLIKIPSILDSDQSDKCISLAMMCVFCCFKNNIKI